MQTPARDALAVPRDTLPGGTERTPSSDGDSTGQRPLSAGGQSHGTVRLLCVGRRWLEYARGVLSILL